MSFLSSRNLEISSVAKEKILSESIVCEEPQQIATLTYALRIIEKSNDGKVIAERPSQFVWGCHYLSDVPTTAQWSLNGIGFAIQDGRWQQGDGLFLDVVGGSFCIQRS